MKILIAEADSLSRTQLKKLLQKSGHEVVETTNKAEILIELKKVDPPKLAIIDWPIAGQDDSIISQIHTLNSPYPRHLIVLTTEDQKAAILTELQTGTDDYLVKPFTPEELQIRIAIVNRLVEMQMQLGLPILEQNQDEKDLQNLDIYKRDLSDASFESIFLSRRGICLAQNLTASKMFGYTQEEAIGRPGTDWIVPADREMVKRKMLEGATIPYETTGLHKDGSTFPVEIQGRMMKYQGGHIRITAIRNITDRKQEEIQRKKLEIRLHQKQKTEALGVLAGGIAHDFNNILAIILSNIELIELKLTVNTSTQESLQHIKEAIFRASETVKQILSFSRPEGNFERIKIASIIDKSLTLLRASIPSSVDILKIIDSECRDLTIYAAPTQIQQVLINLCNNAVHTMNGQGLLEVSLKPGNMEVENFQPSGKLLPGNYLNLTVKDNGVGMNEDLLARIFDPFFTTKPVNEGNGMGLSIVHGIIKNHAGLITVDSVVGQGSTFQIYLPIIDKAEIGPEKIPTEKSPRGNERILFVEDEEPLVHATKQMLAHQGFIVTAETCSIKALTLFQANPEQFDLVITDQTMPGLSGTELIAEMLKVRPNLLTILCTGHSAKVSEAEAKELGIQEFCLKPLSLSQLAQTVRKVLDGAKGYYIS